VPFRSDRGQPFPDLAGEALVRALLAEIEEEERISRALGVDLTPAGPDPSHAPVIYPPLPVWLERADEVRALEERAWRIERTQPRA
jgi:hypothetical protein